jgi:hypothetical protein
VDCKFCDNEIEEYRLVADLRTMVAKTQLDFDQLAQVEVAMAPLMDRPLKRRRKYACVECPALPEMPRFSMKAPPIVDFF